MKKNFHTTIDYSFLMDFLNQRPDSGIEQDDPNIDIWRDLLRFIRYKTEIDVDIPNGSFGNKGNETISWLFKELLDKYYQNDESIRLNTLQLKTLAPKEFVENGLTAKFILYNDISDTFLTSGNRTGCYYFSGIELLKKWREVINRPKLASIKLNGVRTGAFSGWQDFQCYSHPFNAIIIVDNYLFSHPKNLQNNVFKLLQVLLPKSDLCTTIDIMIIASKLYEYQDSGKTVSIHSLNTQIKKFLTSELNLYNFRLSLVKASNQINEYHDRIIFTNYFVIKSGYPFSVCDTTGFVRKNIDTPIDYTPDSLVNSTGGQTNAEYYDVFLTYIKNEIVRRSTEHTECIENRLLNNL